MKMRNCMMGAGLIEILISLLIISMVIFGNVDLQRRAQQFNTELSLKHQEQEKIHNQYETTH